MLSDKGKAGELKVSAEAVGGHASLYAAKMNMLTARWSKARDSTPARIICPLLGRELSPLMQAILVDNIDYFQKVYATEKEKFNRANLVATACLCGSQKVADFLLQDLGKNYLSSDYEYMLGYVATSMNVEWALSIAHTLNAAKRRMPATVLGLADEQMFQAIEKIFQLSSTHRTAAPAPLTSSHPPSSSSSSTGTPIPLSGSVSSTSSRTKGKDGRKS